MQEAPRFDIVDDEMARVWANKSGAERLAVAAGMFRSARRMILSQLQVEHPTWERGRVEREAARRLSHGAG